MAGIVGKDGNPLLDIPLRGDGSTDKDESAFLDELVSWIPANREAPIHVFSHSLKL